MSNDIKPLIEVKDVYRTFEFGEVEINAIKGANLTIYEGEFLVLFGPSGSGKTTLLNQIGGVDTPSKGEVIFDGEDISKLDGKQLLLHRRNTVGWIFQFFDLIPALTAIENVALALEITNDTENWKQRSLDALTLVGLEDRIECFPSQLTGGERKRVALARALIKKPRIILADEPTGNLNSKTAKKLAKLMLEINQKEGITFAIASHDRALSKIAKRVLYMRNGQIFKKLVEKEEVKPKIK
ncbi:MAG: ABC transporter ATP-binding protein [Candidatus Heimdallarchaeota archaeon]